MQRRLAAILAADIVGYSRLMGADEQKTLADLHAMSASVIAPVCAVHDGKIVKFMGDGWLIEFDSAANAVNCAMTMQDKLADHPCFRLRMGIHAGDVIHLNDDVFGDAVNIAARLESLANPGGVLISDAAYASLDGTLTPSFDDGGERELRNIVRPVRVWSRVLDATITPTPAAAKSRSEAGIPRLTLTPVACSDTRPEVQELADGLTGDLDTYLGALQWIEAGASGQQPTIATYRLRATLRTRRDHLRLEARLTNPQGQQIWAQKFDGDLSHSFDWQDDTVEKITSHVVGLLLEIETHRLSAIPDDQLSAEQAFLRGLMANLDVSENSFAGAIHYQLKAIARAPLFSEAHGELIAVGLSATTMGYPSLAPVLKNLPAWAETARKIPDKTPLLELSLALGTYLRERNVPVLRNTVAAALRRAPFNLRLLVFSGWSYVWMGEGRLALECFAKFRRLGRFHPYTVVCDGGVATANLLMGNDAAAIDAARSGLKVTSRYETLYRVLAAAHALQGDMDQAAQALKHVMAASPHESLKNWSARSYYGMPTTETRYYRGLELAGMPPD